MASNYNQRSGSSGSSRPSVAGAGQSGRPVKGGARPQVTAQRGGRPRVTDLPEIQSTRIGDLPSTGGGNGGGRKPAQRRKRSKAAIAAIVLVVLLVVLGITGLVLRYTSVFTITNLSIKGVEHLTDAEITELAAVPEDSTLLRVDTEAIRNRLLQDTWIEDVHVNLVFPDTLEISVKERTIAAVAEITSRDSSQTKSWAIASDGMWLMPIPDKDSEAGKATSEKIYEDAEKVLHIEDVPYTADPEMGKICEDDNVNNALGIVAGMTTELADHVKTVIASDPASTTLILDSGVEIAFGSSEDIRTKERVCLQLLEQYEGQIAYINVRTVDSPTWRSV